MEHRALRAVKPFCMIHLSRLMEGTAQGVDPKANGGFGGATG